MSLEEAREVMSKSGNTFHCRVARYFEKMKWSVQVSPYYLDNTTQKPREIDLVVERAFPVSDAFGRTGGFISVKLFIECKYIPQTNVFWFGEKDYDAVSNWIVTNTPIRENNLYLEKHHYYSHGDRVAKLFAGGKKTSTENEIFYKAINQCLNSMVNLKNRSTIIKKKSHERFHIHRTLEMPVIVCNSFEKLYQTNFDDIDKLEKIDDNFQLEVNYAYLDRQQRKKDGYFLIDVVDFNSLDPFLDLLSQDANSVAVFINA